MLSEPWKRNLAAIWIAQLVSSMAFSFILPFIPLYIQALGVTSTVEAAQWAGAVSAATALSMMFAQPIWGGIADRVGRKPMVIRSMLGGAIIIGAMGFAQSPGQLLILRFIQGAVTGVVAAATALVATSTPRPRLGFALGMNQVAMFLGTSVGPLVGGIISDTYGYPMAFYVAGATLFIGGIIVIAFVHEQFTPPSPAAKGVGIVAGSRSLLAMPVFPLLISVIFLIQLGGVIVGPILSLFIGELAGGGNVATVAGTVLAATGAVSAISAIGFGRLSDRIGHTVILPVCLFGAAVSYFPQAYVHGVWELLALRMLLGFFLGGLMPSANALVAEMVPVERRGVAFGLTAGVSSLANLVGPLSGAGIATSWGMRAVFLATGVLFTAAGIWVGVGLRRAGLASRSASR